MIIDTCYLIDLMDGKTEAWNKAKELNEKDIERKIPKEALFELYFGAYVFSDDVESEVRMIENLLLMYSLVSHEIDDLESAAEFLSEVDESDRDGVSDADAKIAAVSNRLDEPVLTENSDDFKKLDVEYEEYN